jgi:hypothetical protein
MAPKRMRFAWAKLLLEGWVDPVAAHTMSIIRFTSGMARMMNVRIQLPMVRGLYSVVLIIK